MRRETVPTKIRILHLTDDRSFVLAGEAMMVDCEREIMSCRFTRQITHMRAIFQIFGSLLERAQPGD
jgi:hypothetical protein